MLILNTVCRLSYFIKFIMYLLSFEIQLLTCELLLMCSVNLGLLKKIISANGLPFRSKSFIEKLVNRKLRIWCSQYMM